MTPQSQGADDGSTSIPASAVIEAYRVRVSELEGEIIMLRALVAHLSGQDPSGSKE